MNTTRIILLAIAILLFAIGAWPLVFIPLILMIPTSKELREKENTRNVLENEIEMLKKRVEELEKKINNL